MFMTFLKNLHATLVVIIIRKIKASVPNFVFKKKIDFPTAFLNIYFDHSKLYILKD